MRTRKITQSRMVSFFVIASLVLLVGSPVAYTESRIDSLKRCLKDFDGIDITLPYRPTVYIRACAAPEASYDASKTSDHRRILELIGELTLGTEADKLSSDERYAALQQAMFIHFDALFIQRGYRVVSTEQGNARTEYSAYTQCMLRSGSGTHCVPDLPATPKPPIPYVSLARYERQQNAQTIIVTYKTEAANTWSITLDGVTAGTK